MHNSKNKQTFRNIIVFSQLNKWCLVKISQLMISYRLFHLRFLLPVYKVSPHFVNDPDTFNLLGPRPKIKRNKQTKLFISLIKVVIYFISHSLWAFLKERVQFCTQLFWAALMNWVKWSGGVLMLGNKINGPIILASSVTWRRSRKKEKVYKR